MFFQGHTAVMSPGQHPDRHLPGHGSIFLYQEPHMTWFLHISLSLLQTWCKGLGMVAADIC